MKISIFGLGYVGAVSLACLARDGHSVIGVDIDQNKLDLLRSGKSPIVEAGMPELVHQVMEQGEVTLSDDAAAAIAETELSFVCVGTPALPNGSQDLSAIERLTEQIGKALGKVRHFHTVVIRSTVRPGTVDARIRPLLEQHSGKRSDHDFGLAFQPEFLREGSSIRDYDNPPYTIVGTASDRALKQLHEVFGHLPGELLRTDVATAEMLKYACNAFHAVKVTFANEVGRIAKSFEVDAREVMRLVCADRQLNISPAYLRPGFAFGGSCLPKDLKALNYAARERDVEVPMLANVMSSNTLHIERAVERILALGERQIGLLGLSFKSGTDDLRESPLVLVAERLIGKGMDLRIYDPEVRVAQLMGSNRTYIEETIPHITGLMCASLPALMEHARVLVVGLADQDLTPHLEGLASPPRILDLVDVSRELGGLETYDGLCW